MNIDSTAYAEYYVGMRIEDEMINRLTEKVDGFTSLLTKRDRDYNQVTRDYDRMAALDKENAALRTKIASTEYNGSIERLAEVNVQKAQLEADKEAFDRDKKLEWNKGYAAAYVEVTSKMGVKNA